MVILQCGNLTKSQVFTESSQDNGTTYNFTNKNLLKRFVTALYVVIKQNYILITYLRVLLNFWSQPVYHLIRMQHLIKTAP